MGTVTLDLPKQKRRALAQTLSTSVFVLDFFKETITHDPLARPWRVVPLTLPPRSLRPEASGTTLPPRSPRPEGHVFLAGCLSPRSPRSEACGSSISARQKAEPLRVFSEKTEILRALARKSNLFE